MPKKVVKYKVKRAHFSSLDIKTTLLQPNGGILKQPIHKILCLFLLRGGQEGCCPLWPRQHFLTEVFYLTLLGWGLQVFPPGLILTLCCCLIHCLHSGWGRVFFFLLLLSPLQSLIFSLIHQNFGHGAQKKSESTGGIRGASSLRIWRHCTGFLERKMRRTWAQERRVLRSRRFLRLLKNTSRTAAEAGNCFKATEAKTRKRDRSWR